MKISTNTWHAKIYKYAYNRSPNTDTIDGCTYFRRVSFAIMFYPFYGLGAIIDKGAPKFTNTPDYSSIGTYAKTQMGVFATLAAAGGIGHGLLRDVFGIVNYTSWYNHLGCAISTGLVFIALILLLVVGIISGVNALVKYQYEKQFYERPIEKNSGFFKSAYKAFKEKHCPIITWEKKSN